MNPAPPMARESVEPTRVVVAGQELAIFIESPPLIAAMVEDIRSARVRIWLETYIYLDDEAGRAVAEALAERARAGVDVRLIYDAIGSSTTPGAIFGKMARAGVKVHCFHSIWEGLSRFRIFWVLNRRDHRKLLVVDDRVACFGGMNVADPGSEETRQASRGMSRSAGWRDVHVRLAGPQAAEVAESFERLWRMVHRQKVPRRSRAYRKALLAAGEESIQFFDSGPGQRYSRASRVFLQLIRAAKRRLTFSMAYFLPVGRIMSALLRARRRGVSIQVVVPGNSDVPLVQRATRHMYARLLRRRFHIYERQQNMLHSKVMVMDDAWSVLGSCNLDARSLWINLEFLAVIHSRKLAQRLTQIVKDEIVHSRRVTYRECLNRRWWQRLMDWLAWQLRWWL